MVAKVLEPDGDHAKFLNPGRVPLKRIRNFLSWLVNLNIDDAAVTEKFLREYGDFFFPNQQFRRHQEIAALIKKGELPERPKITLSHDDEGRTVLIPPSLEGELSPEQQARARKLILEYPHGSLTEAWTDYSAPHIREDVIEEARESHDPREREWTLYQVRYRFWDWIQGHPHYPTPLFPALQYRYCPPNYRFEQAMDYLRRNLPLAKLCVNRFCSTPYFLAARASQLYCTDECAAPAKKAAKLKWWNENRRTKKEK